MAGSTGWRLRYVGVPANPEDQKLDRCSRLRPWRPQAFVLAGALGTKYLLVGSPKCAIF